MRVTSVTWTSHSVGQQAIWKPGTVPNRLAQLSEEQQTVSAAVLWLLKGDAGQRALMAWSWSWPPAREVSGVDAWGAPFLLKLLEDPYPAVRYIAARSLKALPNYAKMDYDFLSDPAGTFLSDPDRNAGRTRETLLALGTDEAGFLAGPQIITDGRSG